MRRADKQMTAEAGRAVLAEGMVCRLAMCDAAGPYVVPLNYGYAEGRLYFHSAPEGRKIEILRHYPQVCFEVTVAIRPIPGDGMCRWSMGFRSVVGTGTVAFLETADDKRTALAAIAAQCGAPVEVLSDAAVAALTVFRVDIVDMTGKHAGPAQGAARD